MRAFHYIATRGFSPYNIVSNLQLQNGRYNVDSLDRFSCVLSVWNKHSSAHHGELKPARVTKILKNHTKKTPSFLNTRILNSKDSSQLNHNFYSIPGTNICRLGETRLSLFHTLCSVSSLSLLQTSSSSFDPTNLNRENCTPKLYNYPFEQMSHNAKEIIAVSCKVKLGLNILTFNKSICMTLHERTLEVSNRMVLLLHARPNIDTSPN